MGKGRGKDTMVKCGICGRKFPRHKAKIIYRKGMKLYVCPKCARYLSLRPRNIRRQISIAPP